ncbi:MAG: DNA gyrase subunit A [Chloroflexi bacterium]|nr:DNA gyrase subunit A [Chloroflexota bacterium]
MSDLTVTPEPDEVAPTNSGVTEVVGIDEQMRVAYLDYAMSVIVQRALPDVRDGLKPVHRRILYAMEDLGIRSNTAYKKSARIVGEVLGKYHPHGDQAVYDSMARMAQDFSMRYPLVSGQGNFGSVDGDPPAAMRYTEARLSKMAEELLADLDRETVDFNDNFDGSLKEPEILPARMPNLLMNGSSGIAVAMATNIPPHNLKELVSALTMMIDRYDEIEEISVEELMQHVLGPDFPTGGLIVGNEGIRQAYSTGRGHLIMRGTAAIEENKNGRFAIVITEIPYQLNKTSLLERIAELVREGRLDMIADMRDESDRRGMRIVVELKRASQPKKVLNQLYKWTPLQSTFAVQILALVDGEPRMLTLKRALVHYLEHRQVVVTRRTMFELDKAKKRAHILDGLLIALANLDAVIKTIRESPDADVAKARLMERFNLTEIQAQAILDMQLRRLAALERQKIEDEYEQLRRLIAELEDVLAHPHKILTIIRSELEEVAEKYGDARRTRIMPDLDSDLSDESLVQDEPIFVSVTDRGYIKRVSDSAYRAQGRGGRGVTGQAVKEADQVAFFLRANTLDTMLFFTDRGKVYSERVFEIPEETRLGKGIPVVNILNLEPEEHLTAMVPIRDFSAASYCMMATRRGRVKRVPLKDFSRVYKTGLKAITLDDGDELGWVCLTNGSDDVIVVTRNGKALRFKEKEVRSTGRSTMGVTGIKLKDDVLVGMEVVKPDGYLLVVTDRGQGKRTPLKEYIPKSRGTLGVTTISQEARAEIGDVAQVRVVEEGQEVTLISTNGIVLRTTVDEISIQGRATQGVRVMGLDEGDKLAAMTVIPVEEVKAAAEAAARAQNEEESSFAAQSSQQIEDLEDSMEAPDSENIQSDELEEPFNEDDEAGEESSPE